jgi:hypothetical protein
MYLPLPSLALLMVLSSVLGPKQPASVGGGTSHPPQTGCRVLDAASVVRVQGARVVLPRDVFPEVEVKASGDDKFWGCWSGGVLRDLYAPPDDADDFGHGIMEREGN